MNKRLADNSAQHNSTLCNPAFRIALIYLLLGCAWILLSDRLVYLMSGARQLRLLLSTIKGWVFVGTTAAFLYYFINKYFKQFVDAHNTRAANEERLKMALKASHMGVWEWDLRTDRVQWSPEVYDIVGLKDFDGMFASFGRLLYPDDAERVQSVVQLALAETGEYADEFRIIQPETGEVRWLSNLGQVKYDINGAALSVLGTVQDITERKLAEEKIKRYARRLLGLDEELRQNLAKELHDEIGRDLTALGLSFAIMQDRLPGGLRESLSNYLEDMDVLLKTISHTVRGVMSDLRPPVLDDYGLSAALRWYCDQFPRRSALVVELSISKKIPRLALDKELSLFRVAQEALSNAFQHAHAHTVHVALESTDEIVRLTVSDDGTGFELDQLDHTQEHLHWGLTIMRERVESIHGHFEVSSSHGNGTTVRVELKAEE